MMYNQNEKQIKTAQGLASIPGQVPGLNNIPLNGQAGQAGSITQPQGGVQGGVPMESVAYILKQVENSNGQTVQSLIPEVERIAGELQTPQWATRLHGLANAMKVNSDPAHQTRNPQTGEPEKLAQDMAKEIAQEMQGHNRTKEHEDNIQNAENKQVQAQKKPKNEYSPKKKTRGNPFRVLMGQVGKLLDHGMAKRDIVKYLLRKGYWNEETISKAINIVKDYNKKKHAKPEPKEASNGFNLNRFAQMIDNNETELMNKIPFKSKDDDGLTPDWKKRSTAELFARAAWLKSLKAYGSNNHRDTEKAANLDGAGQVTQIRAELKKRGFTEEEMP